MTQEENLKQLLSKDLCARLPYNVKCEVCFQNKLYTMILKTGLPSSFGSFENEECSLCSNDFKPYLRPMSSMTEEERETYEMFFNKDGLLNTSVDTYLDWILENHFDYRNLIKKGIALEAPEGMYNTKTE